MPERRELDDLRTMTALTYEQLRHAVELIPSDQMSYKAAPLATTPAHIAIHACAADLHYLNTIDGGSRRVSLKAEDGPSQEAILRLTDDTAQAVATLLGEMEDTGLDVEREVWRPPRTVSVRFILLHMLRHKHYHTGQLNYIHFLLGIDER